MQVWGRPPMRGGSRIDGEDGRAPLAPTHDRMMRVGRRVKSVAICETCKTVLRPNAVKEHYENTGHTVYNEKLITEKEYGTRWPQQS